MNKYSKRIRTKLKTMKIIYAALFCVFVFFSCTQTPTDKTNTGNALAGEVNQYKGKPTIHINGEPHAPIIYALTDVPGGRWSWEEIQQHNIKQFSEQGVKLFQLDIFLDHIWYEDGSFNLDIAKKQIKGITDVDPNAGVFFRFHVNPPKWWIAKHPEENVVYDGEEPSPDQNIGLSRILEADPRNPVRPSMASENWRKASGEKLAKFCKEFSQTEEGNNLIGIQVAYGVYGEWHQWGITRYEGDFSPLMKVHFSDWLKSKYTTNENLQAAWGNPNVTFENIEIPDTEARELLSEGVFRHPVKERNVIDYYDCHNEIVADNIIYFSKIVKESWPREIITGTFHGYFFSVFGRQAAGGHLAVQKVLQSEFVDYLSGPQAYYPENGYHVGEPYRSRSLIHSVFLHEKLWLDEYDQQPRRSWPYLGGTKDNKEKFAQTVKENIAQIQRNMLFTLLKGQGFWLYDFGPSAMHLNPENDKNKQSGTNGYWDHPEYMNAIGEVISLENEFLHEEYSSAAEVLAVFDTEPMMYLPSASRGKDKACVFCNQAVNWTVTGLYYAGVAFDPIHIDDLDKVNLSQYKSVVFFNTYVMDEAERNFIKTKVAKDQRQLVWMYAPGYVSEDDAQVDFISTLTGFSLQKTAFKEPIEVTIDPSFAEAPNQSAWNVKSPVFYIDDQDAETYGSYTELPKPAFGKKTFQDHTAWYMGATLTDYRIFRKILSDAGVNLFPVEKDIIYAGGDLMMVHSVKEGTKAFSVNGKALEVPFENAPATKVVDVKTGEIVLE